MANGFSMQPGMRMMGGPMMSGQMMGMMGRPMMSGQMMGAPIMGYPMMGGPMMGYPTMGGPAWQPWASPITMFAGYGGFNPNYYAMNSGWGLGGLRRWGGTYSPQYTATGLPTDEEIEEMVYDAIDADPMVPYDADINVEVDAGTVTLTGTVLNKTMKHAAGDDVWWVPGVTDVRNDLTVTGRHRARTGAAQGMQQGQMTQGPMTQGTMGQGQTARRSK